MSEIIDGQIVTTNPTPAALPVVARVGVSIREATLADVAFIDGLQKAHSKELGFLPTAALEGKIRLRQVLMAEVKANVDCGSSSVEEGASADLRRSTIDVPQSSSPAGYLIAADRYSRRDEIGYVTQINVVPEFRRHLVAAALLQAQFDRSAYGCRLYCCWCAQDLKANEFWEAMGFTPIAFRTGSRTKGKGKNGKQSPRIHLFWQKRVRDGDVTTPWWYPAKTDGGEMREDRLVFPIPPGTHWRDVLPVVLPEGMIGESETLALPPPVKRAAKKDGPKIHVRPAHIHKGGFWIPEFFEPPEPTPEEIAAEQAEIAALKAERKAAAKAMRAKVDPRLIDMARELRDRWSEQADTILARPALHDVRRTITTTNALPMPTTMGATMRALPNAA